MRFHQLAISVAVKLFSIVNKIWPCAGAPILIIHELLKFYFFFGLGCKAVRTKSFPFQEGMNLLVVN